MLSWTCVKRVVGDTQQAWVGGVSELLGEMIQVVQFVSLFSSVTQSCPSLCNTMNHSTLGLLVHQQLPEYSQIMFIESVMPSNYLILCWPLLLLPSIFPSIPGSFLMSQLYASGGRSIRASVSVLPMNTQDWSTLGWTGWISLLSMWLSRVFSSTTVWKHQFFSAQPFLWSNLTSIHDYWKNHSFDYTDLCWQSNVSAF